MENNSEKAPMATTTSLKPNWGFISLIFFLIFLASFLGGLVASHLFGKSLVKLINKEKSPEPDHKGIVKNLAVLPKKVKEELVDDDGDDNREDDIISQHQKFRDSTLKNNN